MRRFKKPILRVVFRWLWVPVVSFVLVVAVAIGCAMWSPNLWRRDSFDSFDNPYFNIPRIMRQYGDERLQSMQIEGWGVSHYAIEFRAMVTQEGQRSNQQVEMLLGRSGLPFRCMRWRFSPYGDMDDLSPFIIGIQTTGPLGVSNLDRRIPLMPETVGMVFNVLIYSAAIVLGRLAWRRTVVNRRRRKGLCLTCAYPIEPSVTNCPECGEAYVGSLDEHAV